MERPDQEAWTLLESGNPKKAEHVHSHPHLLQHRRLNRFSPRGERARLKAAEVTLSQDRGTP